jgi:hypothetical protein
MSATDTLEIEGKQFHMTPDDDSYIIPVTLDKFFTKTPSRADRTFIISPLGGIIEVCILSRIWVALVIPSRYQISHKWQCHKFIAAELYALEDFGIFTDLIKKDVEILDYILKLEPVSGNSRHMTEAKRICHATKARHTAEAAIAELSQKL